MHAKRSCPGATALQSGGNSSDSGLVQQQVVLALPGALLVALPVALPGHCEALRRGGTASVCRWSLIGSPVLSSAAGALSYLHSRGVIHGNLTPSNVLMACCQGCPPLGLQGKQARQLQGRLTQPQPQPQPCLVLAGKSQAWAVCSPPPLPSALLCSLCMASGPGWGPPASAVNHGTGCCWPPALRSPHRPAAAPGGAAGLLPSHQPRPSLLPGAEAMQQGACMLPAHHPSSGTPPLHDSLYLCSNQLIAFDRVLWFLLSPSPRCSLLAWCAPSMVNK